MSVVATIGALAAIIGVLFFLFCAGLVFWYLLKQKPQEVSANAPAPVIEASVVHASAASAPVVPAPASAPDAAAPVAAQAGVAEAPEPAGSDA